MSSHKVAFALHYTIQKKLGKYKSHRWNWILVTDNNYMKNAKCMFNILNIFTIYDVYL